MRFKRRELFVEQRLKQQGWTPLFHDVRVMHVQVDLLLRNPSGLLTIVEVKSQSHLRTAHVSRAQLRRLMRVLTFLAGFEPVELKLALIGPEGFKLLPVDALTGT